MIGFDGNFLAMQSGATTTVQSALQAEMIAQQVQAERRGLEEVRKLKEQVNDLNEIPSQMSTGRVGDSEQDNQPAPEDQFLRSSPKSPDESDDPKISSKNISKLSEPIHHIDLRV
jgi:hypothetical protein